MGSSDGAVPARLAHVHALLLLAYRLRLGTFLVRRERDTAYREYVGTAPVLFPFVLVYTLKNVRVYLE